MHLPAVGSPEKAELNGAVTIKSMQNMAVAMECRFVYAIVPGHPWHKIEEVMRQHAQEKALSIVNNVNNQMALEDALIELVQEVGR